MWCITLINLHILNHLCIIYHGQVDNPTWPWCMVLLMYCWIWVVNNLSRIFTSMFISDIGLQFSFLFFFLINSNFFLIFIFYLFIFGCVGSSFLVWGLSLVVASRGHSSSRCAGLSLSRPLLLRSTGSRRASSVIVAHGPSCSAACGTFPEQGSNPCPLHWQADSQPLRHQGSPNFLFLCGIFGYGIRVMLAL